MNAILKPLSLYLEIEWKDIWKPIWVDILDWCDTFDCMWKYSRYIFEHKFIKRKNVYKNISKGQYHLIDSV